MLAATEEESVYAWRVRALLRAGYPELAAAELADSGVDLHEAIELVEAGCPPATAARILL